MENLPWDRYPPYYWTEAVQRKLREQRAQNLAKTETLFEEKAAELVEFNEALEPELTDEAAERAEEEVETEESEESEAVGLTLLELAASEALDANTVRSQLPSFGIQNCLTANFLFLFDGGRTAADNTCDGDVVERMRHVRVSVSQSGMSIGGFASWVTPRAVRNCS